MISVTNLTKVYGEFHAIRDVSFSISKGEVVGFLGPNGAGKTTTMRILTGFIPATTGKVVVAGYDVFEDSLKVREKLGYLPENVPLYPEMRVREYLAFRSAIKRIPSFERPAHIERVVQQCWLKDVRNRIIGQLSKGFKQRVGLADALLGSPDVLILDEPTVGLDPNQVRETRHLIKSLAENHTVILSTHILHEVEMICSRIIIINAGRIVADAPSQQDLIDSMSDAAVLYLEARGTDNPRLSELLSTFEGIDRFYVAESGGIVKIEVHQKPKCDIRERLAAALAAQGYALRELRSERMRLEDIFARLTSDKYTSVEASALDIPDALPVPEEPPPEPVGEAEPVPPSEGLWQAAKEAVATTEEKAADEQPKAGE
ncbi:MAG: ATP-binding cassette domain-containing protein [Candidatus Brocadiia bacterium]